MRCFRIPQARKYSKAPGKIPVPNSAPDSLTPKNLNFVRFEHVPEEAGGAVDVEDAPVDPEVVAVPGRH
jgi:hypothetical protein